MKEKKKISRVYKTLTYKPEKKILDYLASKLYKTFSADQLTFFALFGAFIVAAAYQFTGKNLNYLHFANIGIFIHWFGDSLDGRVAGLRGESRPLYGHYLDHIMDSIGVVIIFVGIAMSPIATSLYWLMALVLALLIFNHAYLKTSVTQVFKLSLNDKVGGTEVRILFILFNISLIISKNPTFIIIDNKLFLSDVLIVFFSVLLGAMLFKEISMSLWGKNKIKG